MCVVPSTVQSYFDKGDGELTLARREPSEKGSFHLDARSQGALEDASLKAMIPSPEADPDMRTRVQSTASTSTPASKHQLPRPDTRSHSSSTGLMPSARPSIETLPEGSEPHAEPDVASCPATPDRQKVEMIPVSGSPSQSLVSSSAFADQLASNTCQAPERLADKMVEQLKRRCMDEAHLGRNELVWEAVIPGNVSFVKEVAREVALRAQALGFEHVEWWNGRGFHRSDGRFHIVHDALYDKYSVRLKVRWPSRLSSTEMLDLPRSQLSFEQPPTSSPAKPVMVQIEETLEVQRQLLERALSSRVAAQKFRRELLPELLPEVNSRDDHVSSVAGSNRAGAAAEETEEIAMSELMGV